MNHGHVLGTLFSVRTHLQRRTDQSTPGSVHRTKRVRLSDRASNGRHDLVMATATGFFRLCQSKSSTVQASSRQLRTNRVNNVRRTRGVFTRPRSIIMLGNVSRITRISLVTDSGGNTLRHQSVTRAINANGLLALVRRQFHTAGQTNEATLRGRVTRALRTGIPEFTNQAFTRRTVSQMNRVRSPPPVTPRDHGGS